MATNCFKCNTPLILDVAHRISRQEECDHCGQDLYCCKMCHFYDTSSYNECREPIANRIVEKEKRNFCDHFKLGKVERNGASKEDLLSAADALFKK